MNISRLFTFLSGAPAVAADMNAELDQLVSTVNSGRIHTDGTVPMTAALTLTNADPTLANHATRKSYTDTQLATHAATPHGGGGGSGPTVVRKTADETVTASSVLQDDDQLLFAAAANTTYLVRMLVLHSTNTAQADLSYGFYGPASSTWIAHAVYPAQANANSNTGGVVWLRWFTNATAGSGLVDSTLNGPHLLTVEAIVTIGATAGNWGFRFASDGVGGVSHTVKANSILTYQAL